MIRIFLADSEQPKQDQTDEIVRHLDELRSEFFLDLSHQLRTPITAMKLAMDGLFAQLRDVLSPPQRKLARISRRNIERIVSLVENQLDLLQMLSGERRVCRRLTDLDLLLRELPRRPFAAAGGGGPNGYRPRVERADALEDTGPLYVFTDPEHLVAVIDCIVGVGPPNAKRSIRVDYDESDRCYQLGISVDCVGQGDASPDASVPVSLMAPDFELRAYHAAMERLGGSVVMEKCESSREARIRLPRYPEYDADKDLRGPSRRLRSEAEERRDPEDPEPAALHFVTCELDGCGDTDFLAPSNRPCRDFLGKIRTVLADGDAVIRARRHGTVYLALVRRTPHELERAVTTLRAAAGSGQRVSSPDTIVTDDPEPDLLVREFELA